MPGIGKKKTTFSDRSLTETIMILGDTQEGPIWSIVLRCDIFYLLITQKVLLCAMASLRKGI